MRIAVIGAGAMGCLFGGLLAGHGQQICFLDIRPERAKLLNERGVVIVREGAEQTVRVRACLDPAEVGAVELVLICVKHGQTRAAAQAAVRLQGRPWLLTLQNGMGNAELLAETAGPERLLCGITVQGAMTLGPGRIQHSGVGGTVIGAWHQEGREAAVATAAMLSAAGIATESTEDILPHLWRKLLINVGINAVTALTGLRNGQLLELEPAQRLAQAAAAEALHVAHASGVQLTKEDVERVFAVARVTAANRSSMGQDIDACRLTEIEAINGWIVRRAEELGLDAPVNRTLADLVRTVEIAGHRGCG